MNARLQAACERQFGRYVEDLFAHPRMISSTMAEIPIIGGQFIVDLYPIELQRVACRALQTRERFRHDAPAWAPELPLRHEDCAEMHNATKP